MLRTGNTHRADGSTPHWRAIRDNRGRIVVAINFNNDFGDLVATRRRSAVSRAVLVPRHPAWGSTT
jgi:hypothetical protein